MKPAPTSGLPVSIFVGMTDVGDGNADDVFLAAAAADDLDGVGLEDGHFLGPVRAAVAVDGDLAETSPVRRNVPVLGVGCWVHAGCWDHAELLLGEKVGSRDHCVVGGIHCGGRRGP